MSDERDTSSRLKTYASRLVGCVILLLLAWALVSGLWHREETPQESGPASTGTANDSQGAAPRGQPQAGDGQAPRELPTETGQGAGPDGPWSAEILDDSSVRVLLRQAPVVKAEYRFWDANWQWANPELSVARNVDGLIAVEGTVRDLGLEIAGAIANDPRNVLEYTYVVTANEDLSGITGGGLEFQLDLSLIHI